MPPTIRRTLLPLLALALAGCASWLPSADRIDIQQGNVLTQAEIQGLATGQTRARVRELIGAPVLSSPFHADRWDYLYYLTDAGREPQPQRLTLHFEGDTLRRIVDRYDPPEDPLPGPYRGDPPERERPAAPAGGGGPQVPTPGPDMPGPG